MSLVSVKIDEIEVLQLFSAEIRKQVQEIENELVYWDAKELQRRTCMSWSFIQDTFFNDPRFPKFKVRTKWLFPAKEARQFLTMWLKEQEVSK
ncbi:group-specific protein [Paenibacillus nicotianae]|uniref:Group-specific protein n=1 Tax=Paenibacillus nicotianae TaxID=1526551 RepID=A0ABW4UT19_9BACL